MARFIMYAFALIVLGTGSSSLSASEFLCHPNSVSDDVCERAREIEDEMRPQLPFTTADGTLITRISSHDSTVSLEGRWSWSDAVFKDRLLKSGLTLSEFRAKAAQSTNEMVCSTEVLAAFVRLGGQFRYKYSTEDNTTVVEVLVVHCE